MDRGSGVELKQRISLLGLKRGNILLYHLKQPFHFILLYFADVERGSNGNGEVEIYQYDTMNLSIDV